LIRYIRYVVWDFYNEISRDAKIAETSLRGDTYYDTFLWSFTYHSAFHIFVANK